jgi:heptosyltransferase I
MFSPCFRLVMDGVSRMHILVCLDSDPVHSLPVWAAFTDAQAAIPGLKITVLGTPEIVQCIKAHPSVTGSVLVDEIGLNRPRWYPVGLRARRETKSACAELLPVPDVLIDPFGTPSTRVVARLVNVRRVGIANSSQAGKDRDYSSVFPLPSELHPLQAIRVLFAAVLNYSLHDLAPNYGLLTSPSDETQAEEPAETDLIVDGNALPWDAALYQQFRDRISQTSLRVTYLDADDGQDSARRLLRNWPKIVTAHYILTGLNASAWLAAALGRPGLCLCPDDTASSRGVISTRWATQQMINLDHPPFNQPNIVVESIIQVLQRQSSASPASE